MVKKKKHILFIVENNPVPLDGRVWKEAKVARDLGYQVSIISPIHKLAKERYIRLEGIDIFRHPMPIEGDSKAGMLLEYANALFWELLLSFRIYFRRRFDIIHGANPPDHLFIVALFFKPLGVKFIFDHHDIAPENFFAKFGKKGILYRVLLLMEWLTFKTTNLIVSTNESYRRIAIERGGKNPKNVIILRNGPDLDRVKPVKPNPSKWKGGFDYLIGYVGVIGEQEGIENILDIADYIVNQKSIANIKFIIVGTGPHLKVLIKHCLRMGLDNYVYFTGYIPDEELYELLSTVDICVNPEYNNEFTDKSTMIKILEYMTFSRPIIQFYTTEGEISAGEAALYIRENSTTLFAEKLLELLKDEKSRSKMGSLGRARIEKELSWNIQREKLKKIYNSIIPLEG
ncbi:MAG: glycosyltransferase family 4 protein [Desulfobacteraceae bacterium]|nr:MAG: glycosyltransferase family 4 protein [Desulfobacteraceae bacterium]